MFDLAFVARQLVFTRDQHKREAAAIGVLELLLQPFGFGIDFDGDSGGAEAYLLLLGSMNDESADVRWRACMALGQLGDRRAIFPLKKLLTREFDPKVRQHAEKALHKLEAR